MMTDHEWEHIRRKAFPAQAVKAPEFLWTRVLSRIESEENQWSTVWWTQWRWMLKMTFAIGLLATAGSYYFFDHAAVPLESALEGVSSQHQAITLAHNPDFVSGDPTDLMVEADS